MSKMEVQGAATMSDATETPMPATTIYAQNQASGPKRKTSITKKAGNTKVMSRAKSKASNIRKLWAAKGQMARKSKVVSKPIKKAHYKSLKTPLKYFHRFPDLAIELRLAIWHMAFPETTAFEVNRAIRVSPRGVPRSMEVRLFPELPPMLHVNQEARYEAIKVYGAAIMTTLIYQNAFPFPVVGRRLAARRPQFFKQGFIIERSNHVGDTISKKRIIWEGEDRDAEPEIEDSSKKSAELSLGLLREQSRYLMIGTAMFWCSGAVQGPRRREYSAAQDGYGPLRSQALEPWWARECMQHPQRPRGRSHPNNLIVTFASTKAMIRNIRETMGPAVCHYLPSQTS